MTWLTRTPMAVVSACLVMLPRLQAEESLLAAQRIGVGTGSFKAADARAITGAWRTTALGQARRGRSSTPVSPAQLGGMGIGYQHQGRDGN